MKGVYIFIGALMIPFLGISQNLTVSNGITYDEKNQPFADTLATHHENGQIKDQMTYENGLKSGQFNIYAANGALLEKGAYNSGRKHGRWQKWNEQGVMISEVHFTYGKKDSKWLIWDDNGVLRYVMFYDQGQKIGNWKRFDEAGNLVEEQTYQASL